MTMDKEGYVTTSKAWVMEPKILGRYTLSKFCHIEELFSQHETKGY